MYQSSLWCAKKLVIFVRKSPPVLFYIAEKEGIILQVKRMRKAVLLAVALLICCGSIVKASEVSPRYTYTAAVIASLDFSAGRAVSSGAILPHGLKASSVVVRLQQYFENEWRTIGMWSGNSSGGPSEAGGSEEIDTGFEYRTYTRGTVYDSDGNVLEIVNFYSDVKYY